MYIIGNNDDDEEEDDDEEVHPVHQIKICP